MIANFTTFKQSEALVEAGVNPETADMRYNPNFFIHDEVELVPYMDKFGRHLDGCYPCWSVARLLALLPDHITVCETGRTRKQYHLEISKYEPWDYGVCYVYGFYPDESVLKETGGENLLDALVEMLCWVMDNHYEDTETQSKIINEE
jgi:hypothetical protein